ncbi:hypothetical protein PMAYCL1PPCAC_10336, partial [Pristionchus mayeri]
PLSVKLWERYLKKLEQIEEDAMRNRGELLAEAKLYLAERAPPRDDSQTCNTYFIQALLEKYFIGKLWYPFEGIIIGILIPLALYCMYLAAAFTTGFFVAMFSTNLNDNYDLSFGPIIVDLLPEFSEHEHKLFIEIAKHGNYETTEQFFDALKEKSPDVYEFDRRHVSSLHFKVKFFENEAREFTAVVVDLWMRFQDSNFPGSRISNKEFEAQFHNCIMQFNKLSVNARHEFEREFPATVQILERVAFKYSQLSTF